MFGKKKKEEIIKAEVVDVAGKPAKEIPKLEEKPEEKEDFTEEQKEQIAYYGKNYSVYAPANLINLKDIEVCNLLFGIMQELRQIKEELQVSRNAAIAVGKELDETMKKVSQ